VAVIAAFAWQWLNVRYTYGGDWTGLFCAGALQRLPPKRLLGERLYAEPASAGFDGQFYHYIAHDPALRSGLAGYVDSPRLRYRRILLPGLAYLLAAGRQPAIDAAYFAVVLGFVFLGVWWLGRFAALQGKNPAWGLLFLLLPATLGAVDRMVVDVALAALWAGFALYAAEERTGPVLVLLVLAPLARETGFAMTAVYAAWMLLQRKPVRAAVAAATTIPCLAWYAYLDRAAGPDVNPWVALAPGGLLEALRYPYPYPWSAAVNLTMRGLDYVAAAGAVAAVAAIVGLSARRPFGLLELAAAVQGALGAVLVFGGSRDLWVHIYGYGRVLSPVLLFLALGMIARRYWAGLVPRAMILPRMGMEFAGDTWRIVRGLAGTIAG
jgi:hypothetical protein